MSRFGEHVQVAWKGAGGLDLAYLAAAATAARSLLAARETLITFDEAHRNAPRDPDVSPTGPRWQSVNRRRVVLSTFDNACLHTAHAFAAAASYLSPRAADGHYAPVVPIRTWALNAPLDDLRAIVDVLSGLAPAEARR